MAEVGGSTPARVVVSKVPKLWSAHDPNRPNAAENDQTARTVTTATATHLAHDTRSTRPIPRSSSVTRCQTLRPISSNTVSSSAVHNSIGTIDHADRPGIATSWRCSRCHRSQRTALITITGRLIVISSDTRRSCQMLGTRRPVTRRTRPPDQFRNVPIARPAAAHSAPTAPWIIGALGSSEGRNDSHHNNSATATAVADTGETSRSRYERRGTGRAAAAAARARRSSCATNVSSIQVSIVSHWS